MTTRRAGNPELNERADPAAIAARLGVPAGDLGAAAAQAVAGLFAQLEEAQGLADRDVLTPLLNRRAFVRELARALAYAERYGASASLVYFDVDGFKAVNDRLGHAAGDAVLKEVAERLLSQLRASDLVGRMGGDEFAVLLQQTDGFQAEAKAAQLARAVAELTVPGGPAAISVSWGVAQARGEVEAEELVAEADAAMFAERRTREAG